MRHGCSCEVSRRWSRARQRQPDRRVDVSATVHVLPGISAVPRLPQSHPALQCFSSRVVGEKAPGYPWYTDLEINPTAARAGQAMIERMKNRDVWRIPLSSFYVYNQRDCFVYQSGDCQNIEQVPLRTRSEEQCCVSWVHEFDLDGLDLACVYFNTGRTR